VVRRVTPDNFSPRTIDHAPRLGATDVRSIEPANTTDDHATRGEADGRYAVKSDSDAVAQHARAPLKGFVHANLVTPAVAYDVANTPAGTISTLKQSKIASERDLGFTIENAKASYAEQIKKGARIVVTTSAGNGGQPVLVIMGPGFDPTQKARVHTHYHGDDATVADPRGSPADTTSRIAAVQARDPQTVFVLPECANPSRKVPAWYDVSWSNVSSQALTTDDALKAAGITLVGKQIVSAHSRGGSALAKIIKTDPAGLRADRLELQDCLYGSQAQLKDWAATANGKNVQSVVYYRATNPPGRDHELERAFSNYKRIDLTKHDHYNTVGKHMDAEP
jgi:hypothetical protein